MTASRTGRVFGMVPSDASMRRNDRRDMCPLHPMSASAHLSIHICELRIIEVLKLKLEMRISPFFHKNGGGQPSRTIFAMRAATFACVAALAVGGSAAFAPSRILSLRSGHKASLSLNGRGPANYAPIKMVATTPAPVRNAQYSLAFNPANPASLRL